MSCSYYHQRQLELVAIIKENKRGFRFDYYLHGCLLCLAVCYKKPNQVNVTLSIFLPSLPRWPLLNMQSPSYVYVALISSTWQCRFWFDLLDHLSVLPPWFKFDLFPLPIREAFFMDMVYSLFWILLDMAYSLVFAIREAFLWIWFTLNLFWILLDMVYSLL